MTTHTFRPRPHVRRGVAMLAFVAAALMVTAGIFWLTEVSASSSVAYQGHFLSTGAFYAAESGAELALREANLGSDLDGDGAVGTISLAPALPNGSFVAAVAAQKYTSTGTWHDHVRITETTLE